MCEAGSCSPRAAAQRGGRQPSNPQPVFVPAQHRLPTPSHPMHAPVSLSRALASAFRLLAAIFLLVSTLPAQSLTGTITGRVFNPATGSYLERVQLTVEGTTL